mmetsp:Transcript_49036/g.114717  ORF Transcript_49036/g.114717 Transcript_49036/m.114717 type:complete len:184 (+) Transcript_49036:3-554(+)
MGLGALLRQWLESIFIIAAIAIYLIMLVACIALIFVILSSLLWAAESCALTVFTCALTNNGPVSRYCSACRDKLWTWAGKGFNWLRVTLVYFWALCGVAIVLLGALIGCESLLTMFLRWAVATEAKSFLLGFVLILDILVKLVAVVTVYILPRPSLAEVSATDSVLPSTETTPPATIGHQSYD